MTSPWILQVNCISKSFGGVQALKDVSFSVPRGSIFSLIGPNGAGKTTLFNIITGLMPPTSGDVVFQSSRLARRISGLRPDAIARAGIARTYQNIRLFSNLTVLENVKTAFHARMRTGLLGAMLGLPGARAAERDADISSMDYLRFVGIEDAEDLADNLPYGRKRRLEIARALATRPECLLLDEPAAGMNPTETADLMHLIRKIRDRGITVFLIEHDMELVMKVSDRIVVLDYGGVIAEGAPEEIKNNGAVIAAYLGGVKS